MHLSIEVKEDVRKDGEHRVWPCYYSGLHRLSLVCVCRARVCLCVCFSSQVADPWRAIRWVPAVTGPGEDVVSDRVVMKLRRLRSRPCARKHSAHADPFPINVGTESSDTSTNIDSMRASAT